ncbi:MAG: flagellar export chaperone FlgN [Actinomycetota bacterium]
MDELAGLLSRERRLLEVLLFKLVTARHLLAAGETRFLTWAAAEVERATERVRESELLRAAAVQRLARTAGLAEDSLTLKALASESPQPYQAIFEDHRQAFFALVAEIEEVTAANRNLAHRGMREVTDVLAGVDMSSRRESDLKLYGPAASSPNAIAPARFDGAV